MEQAELRQWESKCIQEEPPQCVAACPLHVDGRTFCSLMAQKRWDKAWTVLAKTMPLPGVLARICDAPCREACVRKDAGGPIEMGTLERFCAETAKPVSPPRPLPSRHKHVAVVGGNLTGLCAAWEMARRGFDVTLYCDSVAGELAFLDEGVLVRELENLGKLGVTMETGIVVEKAMLLSLIEQSDAVFLDSDAFPELAAGLDKPDAMTLGTQLRGLFASPLGEPSFILQAATGRRAANSLERFTQGVSMVTGREKEGAYETRLFTSLEKVSSASPVSEDEGYDEKAACAEARRCLQCECLECVKKCEYLKHYKAYPKVYARQISNNESIVMGTRQANGMINSCTLCGLCEVVCPEDFAMADLCHEARLSMVQHGKMPQSAHEFALRDMLFANRDSVSLARHAPGTDSSEYVFFPGCQLTASNPGVVQRAYADLCHRIGQVGLILHCCGIPAEWAGREDMKAEATHHLAAMWASLGQPKIIASCPSCLGALKKVLPGAEITSHYTILRALGVPRSASRCGTVAINDPCSARHDLMMREDVRMLLGEVAQAVVEPELTGETTECCGYGGLVAEANSSLADAITEHRADSVQEDFVTYCIMCRDRFVKVGKRALHLYDVLYPVSGDAGARPSPGYSERRENRVHLREHLLREMWREQDSGAEEPFESIEVTFTEEAARLMEERRILKSDVQKTLLQVRDSGRSFVNSETGRLLASFRPVTVTYWVEFERSGDVFTVHNVWCHRMRIKGGQA
ncbi:pyridine nucleotide-disulfide oxidoreductase/dicluster-binding protein [Pseudodesulfovibrio piezophilus]|uniref:Putative Fe-S oxidoreductase n=1 Tax=Pseudodesulfovibrio piezophilus (strain DSM 21447 / JCM 15486 / C1TLV30) TaxID=1322246 RepID=M1WWF5_PSEP2|nr:pyridine nucleotide-disulfide oxidoreductase/dicluster-binding protein [Pseudodesulfovibrio piezophilus]CCH49113.1 putative Fe-S oxidoreductase [Pseudodesulfovibrio piezophilus C1TLV30]